MNTAWKFASRCQILKTFQSCTEYCVTGILYLRSLCGSDYGAPIWRTTSR